MCVHGRRWAEQGGASSKGVTNDRFIQACGYKLDTKLVLAYLKAGGNPNVPRNDACTALDRVRFCLFVVSVVA